MSFVYAKQKNVPTAKAAPAAAGDVWTWTAIDADTKLMPSWFVGNRDSDSAVIFMNDLASRPVNRVQLTSDGHKAYLEAVEGAWTAPMADIAQPNALEHVRNGLREPPTLSMFPRHFLSAQISC